MLRPHQDPPGATGPAMAPGGQAGATQDGMAKVRQALEILQKALPDIPMGSDVHTATMKAITELVKHVHPMNDDPQAKAQQAAQMARQSMTQPNEAMLAKLMPGAAGAGGGAPAMAA
jgi:hypothetical protein